MTEARDVQKRLGRRVAEARDDAGLTQAALAERIGMERTQLVRVEKGERKITVSELAALANDLGLPIDWFVSDSPPAVLSRRRDLADAHASSRLLDLAVDRAARDAQFLLELGILQCDDNPVASIPTSYQEAELLADALRRRVGAGDGPLPELGAVVEQLGLLWFSEELGELAGDGACVEVSGTGSSRLGIAVVNGSSEPGRRRWTLAHELGHFVVGDAYAGDHPAGEAERYINAFVAYFLMPRAGVGRLWNEFGDEGPRRVAMAVSARFQVSWSAACNQLRNLDRISEEERSRLADGQPPRRGEFVSVGEGWPQDLLPPSVPPDYSRRVLRAFAEGDLTADRTIELLRGTLDVADLPPRVGKGGYPVLSLE